MALGRGKLIGVIGDEDTCVGECWYICPYSQESLPVAVGYISAISLFYLFMEMQVTTGTCFFLLFILQVAAEMYDLELFKNM